MNLPSSTKETLEFAAEISRGEQFFKSGLIYPVSFILYSLCCINVVPLGNDGVGEFLSYFKENRKPNILVLLIIGIMFV